MPAARKPWLKWFPTDWRADPALRMCGLAARGLWIELLGYMHEADPYGHLLINGKPPTRRQIATLVGVELDVVEAALAELREAGVYDEVHGVIVSRRMVRDAAKAAADAANGALGGNPSLRGEDKRGVNPPDKAQDKARARAARGQKPEARATPSTEAIASVVPMDKQGGSAKPELPQLPPERIPAREPDTIAPTAAVWAAYSRAYFDRYGTEPVRNKTVNGQLANLVARLGGDAPQVAAFYVAHQARRYIEKQHMVGLLLHDAEGLRTQWARGRSVTEGEARAADRTATAGNAFDLARKELRDGTSG